MVKMIAFVFPGQGSQYVGMSKKIPESSIKKELFDKASEILGFDILRICDDGSMETLTSTENTQPALFTVSSIYDLMLKDKGIKPEIVAGHSLGEYSALFSAGVISFEDGVSLVRNRGILMKQSAEKSPGKMLAVIGLSDEKIENVVKEASQFGIIVAANFNSPGQVVLSGENIAIEKAQDIAKKNGARLVRMLNVSAPFHSPLMQPIVKDMSKYIDEAIFNCPEIPIVQNATGEIVEDVQLIKENLKKQLTSAVLWTKSVGTMSDAGVKRYYEVGPKNVLKGLISRTIKGAEVLLAEALANA
jgi:[acyl-carrier-protein] S-malonyltransferase